MEDQAKTQITPSTMSYHYRAAVHLNNTAVELLQKKCLQQAMDTFCAAVLMMKTVSDQPQAEEHLGPFKIPFTTKTIQAHLQYAAQRLSNPSPTSILLTDGMTTKVISDDESLSTVLSSFHPLILSKSYSTLPKLSIDVNYLVRIESVDMCDPVKNGHSLHSAMILFNCGMAYRCLSLLKTSAPYAKNLREGAHYFFHLSYALLSSESVFDNTDNSSPVIYGPTLSRVLLLTILTLLYLLELTTKMEHYIYFLNKLESLLPVFLAMTAMEENCVRRVARAA